MNADSTPPADPWALFAEWYAFAQTRESAYPDAMILATIGENGMPSARAVLMKGFDERGLVFHTNRMSRKGRELAAHARAAACFYWKSIQRQIRVEGGVTAISDAESDAYFASRPRDSQIGAWASLQSQTLMSRADLEKRMREFEKKYEGKPVPRPPHWGGYCLSPVYFEFWQEQPHRLHDRIVYEKGQGGWKSERLFP